MKTVLLETTDNKEMLHRTSCDVITGYENGLNGEMS